MGETIYKLQPTRTIHLQGFSDNGAAASVHSATETSFEVSGVFRDPADFTVLRLFDRDDFYGHPRFSYLPSDDFTGLALAFDLLYENLQYIDSPKFATIDWPFLSCQRTDGTLVQLNMFDRAVLQSPAFPTASGIFDFEDNGFTAFDRVTLHYLNFGFDYIVPGKVSTEFPFFAAGQGTAHNITVDGVVYSYVETAGNGSADVANGLISAIENAPDPHVSAATGSAAHIVRLRTKLDDATTVVVSASGSAADTLHHIRLSTITTTLRDQINAANWEGLGPPLGIRAVALPESLVIYAARYGRVDVAADGVTVTWTAGYKFTGLDVARGIWIDGAEYAVASLDSPTQLTLAGLGASAALSGVRYAADRGGVDGNMCRLYELHKNDNLKATQSVVQLSGGDSQVTWRVTVDFSAEGITSLQRIWMTFGALLADSAEYTGGEFRALFSNWNVTGPAATRALPVAAPGSVRIEEHSSWVKYTGFWEAAPEATGFFSEGRARRAAQVDATATVETHCSQTHDIYIGTRKDFNCGIVEVTVDGDTGSAVQLDLFESAGDAQVVRRKAFSGLTPGSHSVEIRLTGTKNALSQGFFYYFDFLECAVPGDVPDPVTPTTAVAVATDWDTDHTYKLTPQRLLWAITNLGLVGSINHYCGVFWWNQRRRVAAGNPFPTVVVTFGGSWSAGETIFLDIGGISMGKTVFPADTLDSIALHFVYAINALFVGVWASASGAELTVTLRSPKYSFTFSHSATTAAGTVTDDGGQLSGGDVGEWFVDENASPVLNRGFRDWHVDFFSEAAAAGIEVVSTLSHELVKPPDNPPTDVWVMRFPDGRPVETDTGFGGLKSSHCSCSPVFTNYIALAYREIATLMENAGLVAWVQRGEVLWWFFSNYNAATNPAGGMSYYDDDTVAAFQAQEGRPLHLFRTPADDPTVNGSVDADFLAARLRSHFDDLRTQLAATHPNAKWELLWPLDVNEPESQPLNFHVNLPPEWRQKSGSGFDRFLAEGFQFGRLRRDANDIRRLARYPFTELSWPRADCGYLMGIFDPGWPFEIDFTMGQESGTPVVKIWAWDHVCLFGRMVPLPRARRRSGYQAGKT